MRVPDRQDAALASIADNDIFTGREVRAMLARLHARMGLEVRWLDLESAADVLAVRPDALRKRCQRWALMERPPVRVRKRGPAAASRWLLDESDCHRMARRRTMRVEADEPPLPDAPAGADLDELASRWCEIVTRNLS
jgi:hypothetical protein